jgi:hypothetical protein
VSVRKNSDPFRTPFTLMALLLEFWEAYDAALSSPHGFHVLATAAHRLSRCDDARWQAKGIPSFLG